MEYNFLCYNYYTLFVSYIYSKELRIKGFKCNLIIFQFEIEFNGINESNWDKVIYVNAYEYRIPLRTKLISSIRKSNHDVNRRYYGIFGAKALTKVVKNRKDVLVVFKDNDAIFASVIEKFKSLTKNQGKVVLIEEGLALYTASKPRKYIFSNKFILKRIRSILGISIFGIGQLKQGYHPEVDILLAKEIDYLDSIQKYNRIIIPQSKCIFSNKNNVSFVDSVFKYINISNKVKILSKCEYLFIGQPLAIDSVCSCTEEINFLRKVFSILPSGTNILIKPHPRENTSKYKEINREFNNISILDGVLAELPAEVIYGLMENNPIVLTAYSSAYKNIQQNYQMSKIYLLYKLLNKSNLNSQLTKATSDATIIESLSDLASIINDTVSVKRNQEIIKENKLTEICMLIKATE